MTIESRHDIKSVYVVGRIIDNVMILYIEITNFDNIIIVVIRLLSKLVINFQTIFDSYGRPPTKFNF